MNEPKSIMMKTSVQNFKASLGKLEELTLNIVILVYPEHKDTNVYVCEKDSNKRNFDIIISV